MTIYQKEMRRLARHYDCDCVRHEATGNLDIYHDGERIVEVTPQGHLQYPKPTDEETKALVDKLIQDAKRVREYVGIYEAAPAMVQEDVAQYRKFSEYGTSILAATYDTQFGFTFCTWDKGKNDDYVRHGHYTTDYTGAKEDFAVRSGLVKSCRLFDINRSMMLFDAVAFTRENSDAVDYQTDCMLADLQRNLAEAFPQLAARQPDLNQTPGMSQTM